MYSRNRWLALAAPFWGVGVYSVWKFGSKFGPSGLMVGVLGILIGWLCAEYLVIPHQYRWMMQERQGTKQDEQFGWRVTLVLAVVALILRGGMDLLGDIAVGAAAILACAGLGTILVVGAFSKLLASVPRPGSPHWAMSNEEDARSDGPHRKHRRRRNWS